MNKEQRIAEIENTLAAYRMGWLGLPVEDLEKLVVELVGLQTHAA